METGTSSFHNTYDKWSKDMIVLFLEEYKKRPCLWDKNHRLYKSRRGYLTAVSEIMKNMNLQDMEIGVFKTKVRNIRNTYRQEVMKVLKNSKPEEGAKGVFVPRLHWYSLADSFLRKTLDLDDTTLPQRYDEESTSKTDVPMDEPSVLEFEDVKPCVEDLRTVDAASWTSDAGHASSKSLDTSNDTGGGIHRRLWDAAPPPMAAQSSTIAQTTAQWRISAASPIGRGGGCGGSADSAFAAHSSASTAAESAHPSSGERLPPSVEFEAFGRYVSLQLQQLPLDVAVELEMDIVNLVCRKRLELLRRELTSSRASAGTEMQHHPF
ncbi:uncharacterized protein LOC124162096 isoform X2 [Ischnura elegans]|uniref:uncharacterized protein LOC124162096 isoform X2 n=1 Tax=Ischnura elegans TaxID=197161 RepID=UPI001ED866F2|nr:uncharacterized protein LOC124162096 isoform X2 [Ischnura elegans]